MAKEVAEKQKVRKNIRKNKGQKLPQFLPPNIWNSEEDVIDEVVQKYYLHLYESGRLN